MWRRCIILPGCKGSGVTLASELVTRRQELFDTMADSYTIIIKGEVRYKNLTQEEYFEYMDDLSIEYYQTGRPRPSDIETKITGDYKWQ